MAPPDKTNQASSKAHEIPLWTIWLSGANLAFRKSKRKRGGKSREKGYSGEGNNDLKEAMKKPQTC